MSKMRNIQTRTEAADSRHAKTVLAEALDAVNSADKQPVRTLRFDSVGGASGDMILASLIDLGLSVDTLLSHLKSIPVEKFDIVAKRVVESNLSGTRVEVLCEKPHGHSHPHRTIKDISSLIHQSRLPDAVKKMSLDVFQHLAKAEAKVHGTTPDQIHFHEVGAIDSIVDIVSSCLAIELLGVNHITFGPLPEGRGTTKTDHGVLPLPVPAVAELMKGFQIVETDEPFELVTPTGAALLTTWQKGSSPVSPAASQPMTILRTGYGIGHRKLKGRANVIRATLMEAAPATSVGTDQCLVLECNVDDTVPELLGSLVQSLMDRGALDAFMTPIHMKKQRPATLLTVLCTPEQKSSMLDLIFRESTTFGIREHITNRTVLDRRHAEVETPYGKVRIKIGRWQNEDITWSPEHDDCVRCARDSGVSVRVVYEAALRNTSSIRPQIRKQYRSP